MTENPLPGRPAAPYGTVYLARHGRTPLNADGRLRGHLDRSLDPVGRAEVIRLAQDLRTRGVGRVITSPLTRARETAQAIATAAGVDVSTDERLMDRDYGQWTGELAEDVLEQWGELDAAPGVEERALIEQRVCPLLDVVANTFDLTSGEVRPAVVLVAHDAVNRILLAAIDPGLGDPDTISQRTACWNEIVRSADGWTVVQVDVKDEPPVEASTTVR